MAGVVIGHGLPELAQGKLRVDEDLGDVPRLRGEAFRDLAGKPVAVFLERGAAARGIGHDHVHVAGEARHEAPREPTELVEPARVQMQGATASLRAGDDHVPTGGGEQARGARVDVGEKEALNAAREQSRPAPCLAARGDEFPQRLRGGGGGEQRLHGFELPEGHEEAGGTDECLDSKGLVQPEPPEKGRQARGMRKGLEGPPGGRMIGLRSADSLAHELRARGLQELAERHAGGTGALAAPAAEAEVEVTRHGRREPDAPFRRRAHEIDAPAWRVHLFAEHAIRGALGQADTAVDAGPEPVHGWSIARVEGARARGGRAHSPPTNRPRLRIPRGSNSALSRFITVREGSGIGPHTSAARFSSMGARSTTRLPPSVERASRSGATMSFAQASGDTLPSAAARSTPLPASPTTAEERPRRASAVSSSPVQKARRRISLASFTTMGPASAAPRPDQKPSSSVETVPPCEEPTEARVTR